MKTHLLLSLSVAAIVLTVSLGCEPRPVVEEPPAVEQPAVDVDVDSAETPATDATTIDEDAKVDVQVGGGEGVQVEVSDGTTQP